MSMLSFFTIFFNKLCVFSICPSHVHLRVDIKHANNQLERIGCKQEVPKLVT